MRNLFQYILITSVALSLTCAPAAVNAMPSPVPAAQTAKQKAAEQKKKEAEKKKKEAEKAKAQKAKEKAKADAAKEKEKAKAAAAKQREADKRQQETEKAKAAATKANEQKKVEAEKAAAAKAKASEQKREEAAKAAAKAQAQRDKEAAERAKVAEKREEAKLKAEAEAKAKEEKALRDYEKYQENLENPKPEVISSFNLGLRAGYSALLDVIRPTADGSLWGAGTLNQNNLLQHVKGGGGTGLNLTYNLEYGYFLFETGLDFRFLNSTSTYGFGATRTDLTYGARYDYLFDNLKESRNMMQIGIPVMFGAHFSRYYILVGAKFYYSFWNNYSQSGRYDITVTDPMFLGPYGMGIHDVKGMENQPIVFKQPDMSLALEFGINLDEWLQAQPSNDRNAKKRRQQVKAGQRLPFGREHIHYRAALFAEYGVLDINGTPAARPVEFAPNDVMVKRTNTLLALNGTNKLNTLFVGAKFTIQFEVPGKKARPVPPPPSYAIYSVVDERTNEPLQTALIETQTESGKIALRQKPIGPKGLRQKHALGNYTAEVKAENYYPASQQFTIDEVGSTQYVTIALKHLPVLRVRVFNKETGLAVPATVQILKADAKEPAYSLATDSTTGTISKMLEEGPQYTVHIAQMGYDTLDMPIAFIGDSMDIALSPVKKGEVFIVKNLHFATNKTRILARSEEALQDLYMYLARNPKVCIRIVGHTDNVGNDAANQKLSDGRANAVKADLIERGVAPERIEAEGRGETQPIDTNDTEEGRQNNRRVEIEIL